MQTVHACTGHLSAAPSHLWRQVPPVFQPAEFGRGGSRGPAVQPQRVPFVDFDVLGADLDLRLAAEAAGAGLWSRKARESPPDTPHLRSKRRAEAYFER